LRAKRSQKKTYLAFHQTSTETLERKFSEKYTDGLVGEMKQQQSCDEVPGSGAAPRTQTGASIANLARPTNFAQSLGLQRGSAAGAAAGRTQTGASIAGLANPDSWRPSAMFSETAISRNSAAPAAPLFHTAEELVAAPFVAEAGNESLNTEELDQAALQTAMSIVDEVEAEASQAAGGERRSGREKFQAAVRDVTARALKEYRENHKAELAGDLLVEEQ
jgi:hypothetical protein